MSIIKDLYNEERDKLMSIIKEYAKDTSIDDNTIQKYLDQKIPLIQRSIMSQLMEEDFLYPMRKAAEDYFKQLTQDRLGPVSSNLWGTKRVPLTKSDLKQWQKSKPRYYGRVLNEK